MSAAVLCETDMYCTDDGEKWVPVARFYEIEEEAEPACQTSSPEPKEEKEPYLDFLGQKTFELVRRARRNPEIWAKIQARAAELRALAQQEEVSSIA